jgi:hypothetical protein
MRKILSGVVIGTLLLGVSLSASHAADPHTVRDRWTGGAIGASSVVPGGHRLEALHGQAPVVAAPPAYAAPPPPAVRQALPPGAYAPPVVVHSPLTPVGYAAPPLVVYRGRGHPRHSITW